MALTDLEAACERGQELLMAMHYLDAEAVLSQVELRAWEGKNWDLLSRLYLPLQEARRQRRQRCGEGTVRLDLIAAAPGESFNSEQLTQETPQGQILIAGWGSIAPSVAARQTAIAKRLYLDVFLAASFPTDSGVVVLIVPHERVVIPPVQTLSLKQLSTQLGPDVLLIPPGELPTGTLPGTAATFAVTMKLWEQLHAPFLARAERESDPLRKMSLFRETIEVDYGCELAHQHLADIARMLRRRGG